MIVENDVGIDCMRVEGDCWIKWWRAVKNSASCIPRIRGGVVVLVMTNFQTICELVPSTSLHQPQRRRGFGKSVYNAQAVRHPSPNMYSISTSNQEIRPSRQHHNECNTLWQKSPSSSPHIILMQHTRPHVPRILPTPPQISILLADLPTKICCRKRERRCTLFLTRTPTAHPNPYHTQSSSRPRKSC